MTEATADRATYLPAGLPAPATTGGDITDGYWAATARHELVAQRCNACKGWQWGPEWICHHCHSYDVTYEKVSGKGKIYSWERAWYPVHPALRNGVPYITVLVELPDAGNVRMVGNLLGDPQQTVNIGSEVEAVFEDHEDPKQPYTLVQWRTID